MWGSTDFTIILYAWIYISKLNLTENGRVLPDPLKTQLPLETKSSMYGNTDFTIVIYTKNASCALILTRIVAFRYIPSNNHIMLYCLTVICRVENSAIAINASCSIKYCDILMGRGVETGGAGGAPPLFFSLGPAMLIGPTTFQWCSRQQATRYRYSLHWIW